MAAIIDAPATRSTAKGGNTDFDACKKGKGRKGLLLVETQAQLLADTIPAASVQDRGRGRGRRASQALGCETH